MQEELDKAAALTIKLTILVLERREEQLKGEDVDSIRVALIELQMDSLADQIIECHENYNKKVKEKSSCLKPFGKTVK